MLTGCIFFFLSLCLCLLGVCTCACACWRFGVGGWWSGVSTICAAGMGRVYTAASDHLIEQHFRAVFVDQTAKRWMGLRLDMIGATVLTLAALYVSAFPTVRWRTRVLSSVWALS